MRKWIGVAGLIAALTWMVSACSSPTPSVPTAAPLNPVPQLTSAPAQSTSPAALKVLRIGTTTYPDILDPQKSSVVGEVNVLQLAYEGLVRLDEKGNVQPASADRWESSPDGKNITFHIRAGLERSDGTPLACADFEYALRREVDPFTQGKLYTSLVLDVKGARELLNYADTTDPGKLDKRQVDALFANYGVHCRDAQTLQVELISPIGFWQYIATTLITFPTDRRSVD